MCAKLRRRCKVVWLTKRRGFELQKPPRLHFATCEECCAVFVGIRHGEDGPRQTRRESSRWFASSAIVSPSVLVKLDDSLRTFAFR